MGGKEERTWWLKKVVKRAEGGGYILFRDPMNDWVVREMERVPSLCYSFGLETVWRPNNSRGGERTTRTLWKPAPLGPSLVRFPTSRQAVHWIQIPETAD